MTTFFSRTKSCNKCIHISGDFDLNLLDHDKPTRVTMKTATAIDLITNSFVDTNFKSAIFKTDISDHFPIFLFLPSPKVKSESETTF